MLEAGTVSGDRTDYKTFICRYWHDGSWWSLDISARDWNDAEARVAKLGSLQLLGEQMAKIPVNVVTRTGLFRYALNLAVALRNRWKGG